jgi:hypothetical protein
MPATPHVELRDTSAAGRAQLEAERRTTGPRRQAGVPLAAGSVVTPSHLIVHHTDDLEHTLARYPATVSATARMGLRSSVPVDLRAKAPRPGRRRQ